MKFLVTAFLILGTLHSHAGTLECKGQLKLSDASGENSTTTNTRITLESNSGGKNNLVIILNKNRYSGEVEKDSRGNSFAIINLSPSESMVFQFKMREIDGRQPEMMIKSMILVGGTVFMNLNGLLKCGPHYPRE